jgi:hypothetical protein
MWIELVTKDQGLRMLLCASLVRLIFESKIYKITHGNNEYTILIYLDLDKRYIVASFSPADILFMLSPSEPISSAIGPIPPMVFNIELSGRSNLLAENPLGQPCAMTRC